MLSSFLFLISLLNVSSFHLPQSRTSYSRVRIQDEVRTRINNQYQYQQQLHQYVNKLLVHRSSPTDNFWRIDEDTSELDCESSTGLARKREEEARKKEEEAKAEALRIENERLAAERLAAAAALKAAADAAAVLEKESVVANTVTKVIESSSIADKAVIVSSDANSITGSGSSSNDITKLTPGNKNSAFDVGLIILFPVMIGTLLIFLLFPFIGKQLADSLPPPS